MTFRGFLSRGSLWILFAPLMVWAAHFVLCYVIAAIRCSLDAGGLAAVRLAVGVLTLLALAAVAALARHSVREYGGAFPPRRATWSAAAEDRARFLGNVALLLSALSALAIVFTAVPALVFTSC